MISSHGFDDMDFAKGLQEEYDKEAAAQLAVEMDATGSGGNSSRVSFNTDMSPVDPSLEVTDPNPDIRELFLQFNTQFFWGSLAGIEVKWSPRMTLCAGLCVYEGHGGLCSVRLSLPLLKLRPRKDLVETLLHEMIHAYLFVTDNDRDHDDHGPNFHKHMHRINKATGAKISVYHTFHDEVAAYKQHWWKCDGPCQHRPPYYGMVKRAMNRAPSMRDPWFPQHQATCGGTFVKIKEPEGYGQKKGSKPKEKPDSKSSDIRAFVGKGSVLGGSASVSGKTSSSSGQSDPAKGLSFITNGILTRHKPTIDEGKNPSNGTTSRINSNSRLFSSVTSVSSKTPSSSSSSSSAGRSSSSSTTNIKKPSSNSHNKLPTKSTSGSKKKGFNDNITLLELLRRRQARLDGSKSSAGGVSKEARNEVKGETKLESSEKRNGSESHSKPSTSGAMDKKIEEFISLDSDDDFVVDLTSDETESLSVFSFSTLTSPTTKIKSEVVNEKDEEQPTRPRWENIFPGMSNKKDRDKIKGKGRSKGQFSKGFVSVCEDGDYKGVKRKSGGGKKTVGKKRVKKYIFDELDSNDNLWEEGEAISSKDKSIKSLQKDDSFDLDDDCYSEDLDRIDSRVKETVSTDESIESESDKGGRSRTDVVQDIPQSTEHPPHSSRHNVDSVEASGSKTDATGGHRLGSSDVDTGLSFLAQLRKTMREERTDSKGQGELEGSEVKVVSNKRRSGTAFGETSSLPEAKRRSGVAVLPPESEDEDSQDGGRVDRALDEDSEDGGRVDRAVDEDSQDGGRVDRAVDEASLGMVACPVCTQLVPEGDINGHLDQCLS